jgi:hypothetical protein
MKNSENNNHVHDVMAELAASEGATDTGNESGRRKVVEGFSEIGRASCRERVSKLV